MIVVSVGRTRHQKMAETHQELAADGVGMVELRLDWLTRVPDASKLFQDRPTPVIVTIRRTQDKGRWNGTEDQRQMLLRQAILAGVEYVDIEEDIAGSIRRYGATKRIVSYHNFEETPANLSEIYQRMTKLDADVLKIVTMSNSAEDSVRMLQLVDQATRPTVGFCMGEQGLLTRVLCGKYGSPFTYAAFDRNRELAPGQIYYKEMRDLYRYDSINRETQVYGVLGDPIAQSYSPYLHNKAFQADGLNAVYLPLRVLNGTLLASLRAFDWLNIRGYSVTIPHKEELLKRPATIDPVALEIGAANTHYQDAQNNWHTTNTDYVAAIKAIKSGLKRANKPPELKGLQVLMLGAGGAARAIGLGLLKEGAGLTISNRSKERGLQLAQELGCQFKEWENRAVVLADVIVNCTPVGMFPEMNATPYKENWLRENVLVFDTIYNPENTLLLKGAKARDCPVAYGTEMFVRQAAAQYELFTGRPQPKQVMRDELRACISARQRGG